MTGPFVFTTRSPNTQSSRLSQQPLAARGRDPLDRHVYPSRRADASSMPIPALASERQSLIANRPALLYHLPPGKGLRKIQNVDVNINKPRPLSIINTTHGRPHRASHHQSRRRQPLAREPPFVSETASHDHSIGSRARTRSSPALEGSPVRQSSRRRRVRRTGGGGGRGSVRARSQEGDGLRTVLGRGLAG